MTASSEQQLVDIIFQVAFIVRERPEHFSKLSREEFAEWISTQLNACGFKGVPIGMCWHKLINNPSGK